jgi:hypothetical protein
MSVALKFEVYVESCGPFKTIKVASITSGTTMRPITEPMRVFLEDYANAKT